MNYLYWEINQGFLAARIIQSDISFCVNEKERERERNELSIKFNYFD